MVACDIDPDARLATQINADLNETAIEVIDSLQPDDHRFDLVLLADVLYDKANFALLELAGSVAQEVIVADSRIRQLDRTDYRETGRLEALTVPNLGEFDEFRLVRFFERSNRGSRCHTSA